MKKHHVRHLIVVATTVIGVVVLYLCDSILNGWLPPCLFHKLTGLHCPGCGSGRAIYCLLHGNIAEGFAHNPFTLILLPLIILAVLLPQNKTINTLLYNPTFGWSLTISVVTFGILRNLPLYPFALLAP